ncbi:MAG: DNA-directed DNA polymerase [Candidatus Nanoarchaeia archaeon]|nr:DNA-directed DNA polymerase [Candidatus Nanoarchaeia archaeon]
MELDFIPLDYSYFDYNNKNYIQIIGKSQNNKKICLIDSYDPFFWVILGLDTKEKQVKELQNKIEKLEVNKKSRISKVTKTEIHNKKYLGKDVLAIKVFVTNHKDMHDIASEIGDSPLIIARREYDINIISKYIMEKNFSPLNWYKINGDILTQEDFSGLINNLNVDIALKLKDYKLIEKKESSFTPKVLAYDIETDNSEIGKGKILMISLYGEDYKKVLTFKPKTNLDYVYYYKDEEEMLEAFVNEIKEYNPDVLCGYFSDVFDLPYIKSRADKKKVNLNIGINNTQPVFSRSNFTISKINGIVHIDIYKFISAVFSQYLQTESLSLNEVANELIGEKKEEFDFADLKSNKKIDWNKFYSYNLKDSKITYKLFFSIWPDLLEFCKIIKEPLFDISRDRMSSHVENYILHNLNRFNEIAEKRPTTNNISDRQSLGKYEGAFVYEPTPGLYENIVIFDFTSMYGSVIVTYNLSKSTLNQTEQGYNFSKEQGFFPKLLEEIITLRKKYKEEYKKNKNNLNKARSNAYKLLANASYGYLGFFGARYYCREAAESTAKFARNNILKTIKKIEKKNYKIIYSDTDSIAFLQGNSSKKEIIDLLEELNKELPGIMQLDFEDFYKRGLFVAKRDSNIGAKKKYALIDEKDKLKIRGFETIRRDWCKLAREMQKNILYLILSSGEIKKSQEYFNEILNKLNNRQIEIKDLLIKTQLKKEISEYTSKGPHVIAAEKMKKQKIPVSSGTVIEYYIGETKQKTKKISDKVYLLNEKQNYDIEYYLNNQIIPAIDNIFEVFNVDIKRLIKSKTQTNLGDF